MTTPKNILTSFILILFLFQIGKAQDKDEVYTQIQKNFIEAKESFFLFLVNTKISANTNAHTLFVAYEEIRKKASCQNIYFVFNETEYLNKRQVSAYFEQILKIPYATNKEYILIDNAVYQTLNQNDLTEIVYVYQKKKIVQASLKFFDLYKIATFPYDLFRLEALQTVPLDTNYLHLGISRYFPAGNKLIQMSEVNNRVALLDIASGKLEQVLLQEQLNVIDIYKNYISKSPQALEFAKARADYFKKNNRLDKPFYNAFYDDQTQAIYLSFATQVFEVNKKTFKVPAAQGEFVEIKKGEALATAYLFLLKCNLNLDILELYKFEEYLPKKIDKWIFSESDSEILITDNEFYASNLPNQYLNDTLINPKYDFVVSKHRIKDKEVKFESLALPHILPYYAQAGSYGIKNQWVLFHGKIYIFLDTTPYCYELGKTKPAFRVKGLGYKDLPLYFPQHLEDTKEIQINYTILEMQTLANGKYLGILYLHQDSPVLEIFNKQGFLVQQIPLKHLEGKYVGLSGNYLYYTSIDKGYHYINYHKIVVNP